MRLVNANLAPLYLNEAACEQIKNMPAVDAVGVVRCCDCKYFVFEEHNGKTYCRKPFGMFGMKATKPDAFCSYGKRKEERNDKK